MTTLLDVQGRRTIGYLTNKSGGAVAKGDVVIVDSSNDEAFTTSAAGAEVVAIGVVTEENGIANNGSGRVAFAGYVSLVNVNAGVTRGHFGKTHTVAKQATDAGASRVLGVFCEFLTSGATPSAWLFGLPDAVTGAGGLAGGTPALTLGTSNSAGSAGTGIRTDATIAAFDATTPVAQAFGDAAATGSAGVAARRDHKHGMPSLSLLGYNTAGGSFKNMNGSYAKKITLAATSLILNIGAYVKGNGTNAASFGVAILSDNAGTPLRLIAHGPGSTDGAAAWFTAFLSTTARWIEFPVNAYLAAGDYWIVVTGGNGGGGTELGYDAATPVDWTNASLYPADQSLTAFAAHATDKHSIRALILA